MREQYTRGEVLFLAAYVVYVSASVLSFSKISRVIMFSGILEYLQYFAAIIALLKIFTEKIYNARNILIFIIIFFIGIYSSIESQDYSLICSIIFIFGLKDISFRDILKITFAVQIGVMGLTALCVWNGLIVNEKVGTIVWTETIVEDNDLLRYDLGYGHPNQISAIVFFTTMVYICLREKCHLVETVVCLIINYAVYQKTGSRTSFLIMIVFIPMMFWFSNKKRIQGGWKILLTISPIVIIAVAMAAQIFYDPDNELLSEVNTILSTRLSLGNDGFEKYGVTLFGQKIIYNSDYLQGPYNYIDCFYMRLLLDYGLVVFFLLLIACVITMYCLANCNQRVLCIAFLSVLVHGMIEASVLKIALQPFFLLMGCQGRNFDKSEERRIK